MKVDPAYARLDEDIASSAKILQGFFSDKADKNVTLYKKDMYNFNISYDNEKIFLFQYITHHYFYLRYQCALYYRFKFLYFWDNPYSKFI